MIHLQIHRLHEYILGCDPGQYYNLTELHCEMCLPGTYSPDGDNCIDCPEWQTTSDEGSTSSDDCQNSKKLSIQIKTPKIVTLLRKENWFLIRSQKRENVIIGHPDLNYINLNFLHKNVNGKHIIKDKDWKISKISYISFVSDNT